MSEEEIEEVIKKYKDTMPSDLWRAISAMNIAYKKEQEARTKQSIELMELNAQLIQKKAKNKKIELEIIPLLNGNIQGYKNIIKQVKQDNKKLRKENKYYNKILNSAFNSGFLHKDKLKAIVDKAEVMDYYTLPNVIDDLNKLLEEN